MWYSLVALIVSHKIKWTDWPPSPHVAGQGWSGCPCWGLRCRLLSAEAMVCLGRMTVADWEFCMPVWLCPPCNMHVHNGHTEQFDSELLSCQHHHNDNYMYQINTEQKQTTRNHCIHNWKHGVNKIKFLTCSCGNFNNKLLIPVII